MCKRKKWGKDIRHVSTPQTIMCTPLLKEPAWGLNLKFVWHWRLRQSTMNIFKTLKMWKGFWTTTLGRLKTGQLKLTRPIQQYRSFTNEWLKCGHSQWLKSCQMSSQIKTNNERSSKSIKYTAVSIILLSLLRMPCLQQHKVHTSTLKTNKALV